MGAETYVTAVMFFSECELVDDSLGYLWILFSVWHHTLLFRNTKISVWDTEDILFKASCGFENTQYFKNAPATSALHFVPVLLWARRFHP